MNGFGTSPLELLAADAMLKKEIWCEFGVYSALVVTPNLAATTGTVTIQTQIDGDSDFLVQAINAAVRDNAGANVIAPNMSAMIVVGGAGKQLFDQPIDFGCLIGSTAAAQFANSLPFPRLFAMKNTVSLTINNREAFAPARVMVAYVGFKIYYKKKSRQQIFNVL